MHGEDRQIPPRVIAIGCHAVEADGEIVVVEQALGKMEADEASRPGDQIAMFKPSLRFL
jgi:hypothetical protein